MSFCKKIVLLSVLTAAVGCGMVSSEETEPREIGSDGLLVGFWGDALEGVGTGDYIDQTAGFASNVVMVGYDQTEEVVAKVQKAARTGRKSVIMLHSLLYPWGQLIPYADFRTRFDQLWSALGADRGNVAGFYVYDEPYLKNVGPNQVYWEFIRDGLDAVASYTKAVTGLPSMMVFSPSVGIDNINAFLPPHIDYFGVDCYVTTGPLCSEDNLVRMVEAMKAARVPTQKLLFILDSVWYASQGPAADLAINQRNRFWSRMIGENLGITGAIFPFLYQNYEPEGLLGAESLPITRDSIAVYMAGYLGRVACAGDDLIDISSGTAWRSAPYCQPACEGADLVRRTIRGEFLDAWRGAPMCGASVSVKEGVGASCGAEGFAGGCIDTSTTTCDAGRFLQGGLCTGAPEVVCCGSYGG